MSDTAPKSIRPEGPTSGPFSVLVEPQLGENIGAAARALWNFGLRRMRLVAPRDGWPNPAAVGPASGAGALLDEARVFATTAEAVADCAVVYATTARPREMAKRVLTPEAAMREAAGHIAAGARVALLFGPERAGLANPDVVLASAVVTVPTNPGFSSLNLAQCVLLMAYEWRRATEAVEAETLSLGRSSLAAKADVAHMLDHLEAELDGAHFFFPGHKRGSMVANLRNLFERQALSDQDVRTLRGVIRALAEGPKRRRDADG
ncbi:MAG: RNA methyltransferase [Pseudomonadota bacterium]